MGEEAKSGYGIEYKDYVEWLKNVKLFTNPIIIETATVYVDMFRDLPIKEWYEFRSLVWKGHLTDYQTFLLQVKVIGGYNKFSTVKARELVDYFGNRAGYRIGREQSVVIYISNFGDVAKQQLDNLKEQLKADEIGEQINEEGGYPEIRIFWD